MNSHSESAVFPSKLSNPCMRLCLFSRVLNIRIYLDASVYSQHAHKHDRNTANELVLISELNMDLLRLISENLMQLIELEICAPSDRFYFEEMPQYFKCIKTFKINGNICHMPFKFDNLQELKIIGFNEFTFDAHLMNFILSQENIAKIVMVPKLQKGNNLNMKTLDLLVELPKLIELEICVDNFTNAEIISFLIKSKSLKKVHLWCTTSVLNFNLICSQLENQWNSTRRSVNHSHTLFVLERQ